MLFRLPIGIMIGLLSEFISVFGRVPKGSYDASLHFFAFLYAGL